MQRIFWVSKHKLYNVLFNCNYKLHYLSKIYQFHMIEQFKTVMAPLCILQEISTPQRLRVQNF